MYQAIEAISEAGVIKPLEPVVFDENESLVILRLSRTYVREGAASSLPVDWRLLAGSLKGSVHFNGDPVAIQQDMRHEWG